MRLAFPMRHPGILAAALLLAACSGEEYGLKETEVQRGPAKGTRLGRIPSMSSFWFAWYAMYPEARFELPEIVHQR